MIRFIIKREIKDNNNGMESVEYETIVIDVPELQKILLRGGSGPSGYDMSSLVGFEIMASAS